MRTGVIPADRCLHNLLHPSSNGDLLGGTEEVRSLKVVDDFEAELADMDVGVGDDAVTSEIDEALGLSLLYKGHVSSACREKNRKDVRPRP